MQDNEKITQRKAAVLWRLFVEFFKLSLFVVGGGHAILLVADDVFSRKLKWIKEGELLEHLPIFQMVPGLIAGNTAIYTGLKLAGRLGAAVSLIAVALPSFFIFLFIAMGYNSLSLDNKWIESAFLGLRSSLTGILLATIIKGWSKNIRGIYGYTAIILASAALLCFENCTVQLLLAAMVIGIVLEYAGLGDKRVGKESAGVAVEPLSVRMKLITAMAAVASVVVLTIFYRDIFWTFVKFGLLCFGGGFVLVPVYVSEFVGAEAPFLQIPREEFANLIALTQMTPGPVSVNAATFFGYRFAGVVGAAVATAGLLLPGLFLLTAVLTGLDRWQNNRLVRGLLRGVKPATIALMLSALVLFAQMSIIKRTGDSFSFSVEAILLAVFSLAAMLKKKLSVMSIIFLCAFLSVCATFLFEVV